MEKDELRKSAKNLRNTLALDDVESASVIISEKIFSISEVKNRTVFHLFYPIIKKKEIDLRNLVNRLWESHLTVVMPRVTKEGKLSHHIVHSLSELESTNWGMMEPKENLPEIEPSKLDVIIVPMLMGDIHKNRLGYGAGFYDRFLANAPQAVKIGVLMDEFIIAHVPADRHDVQLDAVITDKRMLF